MTADIHHESEQHPLLPSGYWTGFYVYQFSSQRHDMMLMLDFARGQISGDGQDDVAAFQFKGTYDLLNMTCNFNKYYKTHSIDYRGHIDENGIWGKWHYIYSPNSSISEDAFNDLKSNLPDLFSGGFHIWPATREFSKHELEVRKLKEEEVIKLVNS